MWTSNTAIAVYIALAVVFAVFVACLIFRKTVRTRLVVEKTIRDDPDINDWLVIYNWTRKILYVPTIAVSFVASVLMYLRSADVLFFGSIIRENRDDNKNR